MQTFAELTIDVERIKSILMSRATGGVFDQHEYTRLRKELIADSRTKAKLPRAVQIYRTESEFWSFIQQKFSSYAERRAYLRV